MLEVAKVGPEDIVYDLGCGDGRIIIAAVKNFGAKKAVGVDLSDERLKEAEQNAIQNGVRDKIELRKNNFLDENVSDATVVTLFLLTNANELLKPKFEKELKPGTRVVSHEFEMKGWKPKEVIKVEDGNMHYLVYLYVIGEHQ
ncbi:50S ribosomal protein L11 methyltransferase [Metallosphaera sedula]|uniref:50S ribosomal protein L11 methyltransferase n=1 Tax=Metallosphaera sedula TaxID=43687 RepID=A0A0K1SXB0_9CREN|nr:protein-lysine N-methyltransferase [Metallosphaera sedula]AKV79354.1 50S ribosomal protein L11 methyltransferase [Metallosphaera sedula]AKV81599.1 50S ribosomal protein L11 methyltransferase [Metallosphaera sedula]